LCNLDDSAESEGEFTTPGEAQVFSMMACVAQNGQVVSQSMQFQGTLQDQAVGVFISRSMNNFAPRNVKINFKVI
jgi:hypothetical protein